MIKLIAMLLYVVIGALIGGLFYKYFANQKLTLPICIILGIMGSFGGLFLSDLADIRLVGNLIDSIIFSTIGSFLLLGLNLGIRGRN